jgi:hypothetical protein
MPTVAGEPEQRVVLRCVSWETYERLLAESADRSSPRLAYDRGVIELAKSLDSVTRPDEVLKQFRDFEFGVRPRDGLCTRARL